MRKRLKLGWPSHATVVAYLALFVAIGGSAYAAKQLPKNSVGTKQLKKNAVTAKKIRKNAVTKAKIKKNSVTGAKVKESTLGTVPTAQTANTADIANSLAPSEGWHEVGAPGEPGFENSWKNSPLNEVETAGFFKDHEGIVHLKGAIVGGTKPQVFRLPPGYRPASGRYLQAGTFCTGPSCPGFSGPLVIGGSNVAPGQDGAVSVPQESMASLDTITFRAES